MPAQEDAHIGNRMHALCQTLYPICRSITGNGVRETLDHIDAALGEGLSLERFEVPTGTPTFDWQVPKEWNIRSAQLIGPDGNTVLDFADSNLHVVNYSVPVHERLSLDQLQAHLHSLPELPERVPYRTSYYRETWGFCLSDAQRQQLEDGEYEARIDATLEDGSLTYAELFLPGRSDEEILISTHTCHPSLANDNLSGITVATELVRAMAAAPRGYYGLRFIFIPGTIGSITWLAQNSAHLHRIKAALVISGVGDPGPVTYKRSRQGDSLIDRTFERVLASREGSVRPYLPYGYDERQFCSPGIDIAAGCLMRTPYGEYDAYHNSGDNLDLIRPEALADTFELCLEVLHTIQHSPRFLNKSPNCEPQLGRRGLYDAVGGNNQNQSLQLALLWLLGYSNGDYTLADIAAMSGIDEALLSEGAERLMDAELLERLDEQGEAA